MLTPEEERKNDRKLMAECRSWKRKAAKRVEGMSPQERVDFVNRRALGSLAEQGLLNYVVWGDTPKPDWVLELEKKYPQKSYTPRKLTPSRRVVD
jgi:hypothetical protein